MSKEARYLVVAVCVIMMITCLGGIMLANVVERLHGRIENLEADAITETQTIYVMQRTTGGMLLNQRIFADHIANGH